MHVWKNRAFPESQTCRVCWANWVVDLSKAPKYLWHCYGFLILFYDKKSWPIVLRPQRERQLLVNGGTFFGHATPSALV